MLDVAAALLVLTALLAYLNQRFLRLPVSIGVMAIALALSLLLVGLDRLGFESLRARELALVGAIDFTDVLMQGMLSLLLFAGALHVDLRRLLDYRWQIGLLAVVGTALSTLVVGVVLWWLLPFVGVPAPLLHCLLFGALISPTDPIAVLGILKSADAPRELEVVIAGESLFNDGVGVVIFSLLAAMVARGTLPTVGEAGWLLAREAGGGLLLGLVLGAGVYRLLRSIDQYQVEVLLTLAVVVGGYALASHLEVSGPLAMVVVGLVVGNAGRAQAMSDTTRHQVDLFWALVDDILNAVLFVLIGMEVVVIHFGLSAWRALGAGALAIVVTLAARWLTVGLPVRLLPRAFRLPPGSAGVLTWGALRGGISIALALSAPLGEGRQTLIALTYSVVAFSVLVQGLTFGRLVRRTFGR